MSNLIFIFCGIFGCQDNFRSLFVLTLMASYTSLLLNLASCFDLNQANQRWLQIGSLSDSNANAMLRLQIAKLSDRVDKFSEGRSVFLRSPEMLFLQPKQRTSLKKIKQSSISGDSSNLDSFERDQRDKNRQLAYLVSPFSEQVLEIGKQLSDGLISPNSILEDRYRLLNEDSLKQFILKSSESSQPMEDDECRTIRSTVKLEKDDIEKVTGKVIRTCKGLVQVNKCEGSCTSIVQPSIKSPSGFIKVSISSFFPKAPDRCRQIQKSSLNNYNKGNSFLLISIITGM